MRSELVVGAVFMIATSAWGQLPASKATVTLLKWDVTSVKQADPSCPHGSGINGLADGLRVYCAPALFVIEGAYRIAEPSRIFGAPEWVKSEPRWDIDAKVAG